MVKNYSLIFLMALCLLFSHDIFSSNWNPKIEGGRDFDLTSASSHNTQSDEKDINITNKLAIVCGSGSLTYFLWAYRQNRWVQEFQNEKNKMNKGWGVLPRDEKIKRLGYYMDFFYKKLGKLPQSAMDRGWFQTSGTIYLQSGQELNDNNLNFLEQHLLDDNTDKINERRSYLWSGFFGLSSLGIFLYDYFRNKK